MSFSDGMHQHIKQQDQLEINYWHLIIVWSQRNVRHPLYLSHHITAHTLREHS